MGLLIDQLGGIAEEQEKGGLEFLLNADYNTIPGFQFQKELINSLFSSLFDYFYHQHSIE